MNFKVYILTIPTIAVGLVELIIEGILPVLADDFHISISSAGQLITIYALIYAIAGPVLLVLTSKMERKRLYLITLFVFFLGNMITYVSPNFTFMMLARVLTALATALATVLALTMAPKVVEKTHQAKAVGLVFMGISSSLVMGVPLGILIANAFGWRVIFLIIAALSIASMLLVWLFLERMPGEKQIPLMEQIKAVGNVKIGSAHLATMFLLAAFYTLYAYFRPFLETTLHLNASWVSIIFFIFGVASISGGALGGYLSDYIGSKKSIILIITGFGVFMFLLPFSTDSLIIFIPVMMVWGALSWAINPPQQSYLIQAAPETSDIQQSFNNSAIQIGISLGSAVGGISLAQTGSVISMAWVGTGITIVSLICAIISLMKPAAIKNPGHNQGNV